jgi:hypothetical protein
MNSQLFGAVRAADVDVAVVARSLYAHAPGIAAHFAVLDEGAAHVRFEVNLDLLAAVGTDYRELIHRC